MLKEKVLEDYIEFKKANVTSQIKIDEYRRFIKQFLDLNKPLEEYQETDLVNFLNTANKKYNIRSMNEVKTLVRNFIIWYFPDYPQRFRNMPTLLRHLKIEPTYSSRDMLSKDEVEKLIQGEESILWKTFWLTQFYGGMRPTETARLKWDDITFSNEGAFIEVYVKKNKKNFTKFIPENVAFHLRNLKNNSTSEYVFPSRVKRDGKDSPMDRGSVLKRLKKLSSKILGKSVNPYILRHSIATILYSEEGQDKDFVAEQMGHTRNMEKVYSHLSKETVMERLKKIYVKAESLPPEKKVALEKQIEELQNKLRESEQKQKDSNEKIDLILENLENIRKSGEFAKNKIIKIRKNPSNPKQLFIEKEIEISQEEYKRLLEKSK